METRREKFEKYKTELIGKRKKEIECIENKSFEDFAEWLNPIDEEDIQLKI